ncbi:small nuclear ribonucleoprotein-associated protein B-like [Belonocnema kinseyi]|uniref:small nuclear ribonucleoprotein-associated protein B-like n=1 Tax=Belonocnema kinseyi TaxID=2817044 RepID=UPI00143E03DA|nr:small nuclear ribonucleoprotein-associated protein B-like [Belonocnema kinseyi]
MAASSCCGMFGSKGPKKLQPNRFPKPPGFDDSPSHANHPNFQGAPPTNHGGMSPSESDGHLSSGGMSPQEFRREAPTHVSGNSFMPAAGFPGGPPGPGHMLLAGFPGGAPPPGAMLQGGYPGHQGMYGNTGMQGNPAFAYQLNHGQGMPPRYQLTSDNLVKTRNTGSQSPDPSLQWKGYTLQAGEKSYSP